MPQRWKPFWYFFLACTLRNGSSLCFVNMDRNWAYTSYSMETYGGDCIMACTYNCFPVYFTWLYAGSMLHFPAIVALMLNNVYIYRLIETRARTCTISY